MSLPYTDERLVRIDAARNMRRYYTVTLDVTLFGEWCCSRGWGRLGQRGGQVMSGLFATRAEAEAELQRLFRSKLRRGYRRSAG